MRPFGRTQLPFRAVNRKHVPGYDPALQRHHLLPCQLLSKACFGRLFAAVLAESAMFHDFRRNGLLLPSRDAAAKRTGLPLHRGPHRRYNAMVMERVGQIEGRWATHAPARPDAAGEEALFRLGLLQSALRRRLLDPPGNRMVLNRHDPLGTGYDFAELDAMAESLWGGTQIALADSSAFAA